MRQRLGDSTFLIEGMFAEGSTDNQRFVVYLQPAAGGRQIGGEAFSRSATANPIATGSTPRDRTEPGRVAGDRGGCGERLAGKRRPMFIRTSPTTAGIWF
jgi:hypothetical protein